MTDYGFMVSQISDVSDPDYKAEMEAFLDRRKGGRFGWSLDPERPIPPKLDRWSVSLPHQCDDWEIVGGWDGYVEHSEAVSALEDFIAQAQAALDNLKARQDQG